VAKQHAIDRAHKRNERRNFETGAKVMPLPDCEAPSADRDFMCRVRDAFRVFARRASEVLGTAWIFVIAIGVILLWALTGHLFDYSDTWQLIINTGTTIVTFLMVFLIQNTQNRDAKAVHLKLDELIRAVEGARDHLVDLEKLSDDELKLLESEFERVRQRAERAEKRAEVAAAVAEDVAEEAVLAAAHQSGPR
jgi:low affinity Fe/Cu permease